VVVGGARRDYATRMRFASRYALITTVLGTSAALGLLAACGDNLDSTADDAERCEPPSPALPAAGPLIDPLAAALPCVPGGLRDLPGRWFIAEDGPGFSYEYPRFEGSCETGFRHAFRSDDLDDSDRRTFHTWSDGTRIFMRAYRSFPRMDMPPFEIASAVTACLRADGTLVADQAYFNPDHGELHFAMAGERFAPKDGAPVGLRLLGELGSQNGQPIPAYNVVVDGAYAYTVGPLGFDVIDVSNPAAPVHVGHADGAFNDVRVVRGNGKIVAYAAPLESEETAVIDVSDPAHPVMAPPIPEYSHSLQVQTVGAATYLYLATYTNAVPRYDVTNPLVPARLGEAHVPGPEAGIHDLFVDGDLIYTNNTIEGLVAIDVSAGLEAAVELGRRKSPYSHASWAGTAGGRRIVLHGDEGMTDIGGAFLSVLDGDPASPTFLQELGRYRTRAQVGIHNFQLVGDKAYISYYQDGVRVVDLSMPSLPREVAHYNTWREETSPGSTFEGAIGIRVGEDGRIYVADFARGLLILEETP
jgi:hypothetical protein